MGPRHECLDVGACSHAQSQIFRHLGDFMGRNIGAKGKWAPTGLGSSSVGVLKI